MKDWTPPQLDALISSKSYTLKHSYAPTFTLASALKNKIVGKWLIWNVAYGWVGSSFSYAVIHILMGINTGNHHVIHICLGVFFLGVRVKVISSEIESESESDFSKRETYKLLQ